MGTDPWGATGTAAHHTSSGDVILTGSYSDNINCIPTTYYLARVTIGNTEQWRVDDNTLFGTPVLSDDSSTIFVCNADGTLRAYNAGNGSPIWSISASVNGTYKPSLLSNGDVIIGGSNGTVRCINDANGSQIWSTTPHNVSGAVGHNPTVDDNDNIFVGSGGGVNGLNASGSNLWNQVTTTRAIDSTSEIAIGSNNTLYCLGRDAFNNKVLFALDP